MTATRRPWPGSRLESAERTPAMDPDLDDAAAPAAAMAASLASRYQPADTPKNRILLAALACIAEEGIANTSTRAIARRAGVKQGVIHHYFASKDALLLELLQTLFENSRLNVETLARSDLPPRERLLGIIDLGFELTGPRSPEFIALVAYWAHSMAMGGTWREGYQRAFEDFRSAVVKVIEEGECSGVFRPELSAITAVMLVALVQGVGLQSVMAPQGVDRVSARRWARHLVATMLSDAATRASAIERKPAPGHPAPPHRDSAGPETAFSE